MNIVEIYDDDGETSTFGDFRTYADDILHFSGNYTKVHRGSTRNDAVKEADLVLIHNLLTDNNVGRLTRFIQNAAKNVPLRN